MSLATKLGQKRNNTAFYHWLTISPLIIGLLVFLAPTILVLINSFKDETEFYARGALSLPMAPTFSILAEVWRTVKFTTVLFNSFIISAAVASIGLTISIMNGFAIGIGRIKWGNFLLVFFIFAMFIPQEALVYPLYHLMKRIGLYDTRLSVIIILSVIQAAFGTYFFTSVFKTFSVALLEAARLDGCNKWQVLKMVVALNKPAVSVILVFFFIWTWNEFFIPLVFLQSNANQTIPIVVTLFQGQYTGFATQQSACALLGIMPCLIFFIIFQRSLTRGVLAGGIKG